MAFPSCPFSAIYTRVNGIFLMCTATQLAALSHSPILLGTAPLYVFLIFLSLAQLLFVADPVSEAIKQLVNSPI